MSYEGYVQRFCIDGHYSSAPEDYGNKEPSKCECGKPIEWFNPVDTTNGDGVGVIPDYELKTLLISEAKTEKCNLGHMHVIERARYRIPSKTETKRMRHYTLYKNGVTTFVKIWRG